MSAERRLRPAGWSAAGAPSGVEIHIDALVLHGFSPADRLRIGAALEGELARLFTERGLPQGFTGDAEREAIDAGSFAQGHLATPASIGGQAARAVYQGLGRRP